MRDLHRVRCSVVFGIQSARTLTVVAVGMAQGPLAGLATVIG